MEASDYAERYGWRVFPCIAGEKIPATAHGFKDASSDLDMIASLFQQDHNVGIATGDGLFVLDVDRKEGRPDGMASLRELQERHEPLPVTASCLTPSGGRHYYFKTDQQFRNSASQIAPSLDVRCDGGYVVAPPSIVDGKHYRWAPGCSPDDAGIAVLPSWLAGLAKQPPKEKPAATPSGGKIREGGRNEALISLAGYLRNKGLHPSAIRAALHAENTHNYEPPLDSAEVDKVAESILRYPPGSAPYYPTADEDDELEPETHDPGELPPELLTPPGYLGEVVEWNLRTAYRKQPNLALAGALASLAVLTGRKVCDPHSTRTNLYILGIAESGHGKDHARKINNTILVQSGNTDLIGPEDFASSSGLIAALAHRGCLLFQVDEIGRVLKSINSPRAGSHQSGIITELLRLYSTSNSFYTGRAYADRKQTESQRIDQPHAVLYGTTTPENFYAGLTSEGLTDGFYGRLLAFSGGKQRKTHDHEPIHTMPESVLEACEFWREFKPGGNLRSETPQPAVVDYSEAGRQAMREFAEECEDLFMGDGVIGSAPIWGRAHEKATKLALLYACSECPASPEITANAVLWASGLVRHQTQWMLHEAAQYVSENDTEAMVKRVKRMIDASGLRGLTQNELTRKTQWLKHQSRQEILATLMGSGLIHQGERVTQTRSAAVFYGKCVNSSKE